MLEKIKVADCPPTHEHHSSFMQANNFELFYINYVPSINSLNYYKERDCWGSTAVAARKLSGTINVQKVLLYGIQPLSCCEN